MLTEKEITKINNYLVAIRALCVTAENENTDFNHSAFERY